MHITFKREPKVETRINLNLSIEEATALYWAIDPSNQHMSRWIPLGYREAFGETAREIEEQIASRLEETGNDPGDYAFPQADRGVEHR